MKIVNHLFHAFVCVFFVLFLCLFLLFVLFFYTHHCVGGGIMVLCEKNLTSDPLIYIISSTSGSASPYRTINGVIKSDMISAFLWEMTMLVIPGRAHTLTYKTLALSKLTGSLF